MSVYASRRKEAAAAFISAAREFRIMTIRACAKMPRRYRYAITNNVLTLASEMYTQVIRANNVYIRKGACDPHDYDLRHRLFVNATTCICGILAEISILHELLQKDGGGDGNFNDLFWRWTKAGNEALAKIRAVILSDKKRFAPDE